MAVTVGLLAFLAVDATLEGLELSGVGSQAFGGARSCSLAPRSHTWGSGAFLVAESGAARRGGRGLGRDLALLVAVGIGLHNLGEGVAIGSAYSVGALALGAFLVVGFALHNTTEGLAIVAPVARPRPSSAPLAVLGLVAGGPAVIGAWIGAAAFNSSLAAFLFGFGAGAIVQVIVQLAPSLRDTTAARCTRRPSRAARRHGGDVRDRIAGEGLMALGPATPFGRDRGLREVDLRAKRLAAGIPSFHQRPRGAPGGHARVGLGDDQELDDRGLVEHVPYRGEPLTPAGERVRGGPRHHRLLELFLAERLGVPWDRVHEEAEALEHVISEDLEARIAAKLGDPTHDPTATRSRRPARDRRGTRPRVDRSIPARAAASCGSRTPSGRCCATSSSAASARRELAVVARQPFGGPVTVRFGDERTLGGVRRRDARRAGLAGAAGGFAPQLGGAAQVLDDAVAMADHLLAQRP